MVCRLKNRNVYSCETDSNTEGTAIGTGVLLEGRLGSLRRGDEDHREV